MLFTKISVLAVAGLVAANQAQDEYVPSSPFSIKQ